MIAIVAACVLLLFFACERHEGNRQHVLALIAQSEMALEQENADSAWILLEEACDYAEKRHYDGGMSEACLAMARHHNLMDRPDSAIASLQRGLRIYPEAHDSMLAQYYGELSATYCIVGNMRQAVDYGRLALPLLRKYGSSEDFAVACGNVGISCRRLGQNDSAAIFYQQGLEVAMQSDDAESQAYLSNNLSVLYAEMGRYEESVIYAEKAAQAAIKAGDDVERLSAEANKGAALLLSGHADEAVKILTPTIEQADSTSSTLLKLKIINYMVKALIEEQQWSATTPYLQRGEELAAQLPQGNTASAGILEAKMIVQTEQHRYADALQTIERLETLMLKQQVIPRYKLLFNKGRCLAGLGRYQEAYALQSEAFVLSDSTRSHEANDKLDALTTNYRVMEKELEVSRLNEKHVASQHKISFLTFLLITSFLFISLLLLYLRQRRQQTQMRETRRYVEGIEQERARFARELHDGACNELLSIGMQLHAPSPDVTEVNGQITTLRAQLRNLSHELMPPQFADGVRLDEALAYYLSHLDKPSVNFRVEGESFEHVPVNVAYQYYRIAQEAIGNIIVHQPEAQVRATLLYNKPHLQFNITSQGNIISGDGNGIGLQSITDRAKSIQATLTTKHDESSYTINLDYGTP